jgi:hypothetical protein
MPQRDCIATLAISFLLLQVVFARTAQPRGIARKLTVERNALTASHAIYGNGSGLAKFQNFFANRENIP